MPVPVCFDGRQGFSLIEMMITLVIAALGLLAAGRMLYIAAGSVSLARSKDTAALAAQSTLESLHSLYGRNPPAQELAPGIHGPEESIVVNPLDGTVLNRYRVNWFVENVSDPRPGKELNALRVRATVTPIQGGGYDNARPGLNKIVNIATVFSRETQGQIE